MYVDDLPPITGYVLGKPPAPIVDLNYFKRSSHWGRMPHSHDYIQFLIVTRGEMTLLVDGEEQVLRAGEASLIMPGIEHELFSDFGYEQVGANIRLGDDDDLMGVMGLIKAHIKTTAVMKHICLAEQVDNFISLMTNSSAVARAKACLMMNQALIESVENLVYGDKERFDAKLSGYIEAHLEDRLTAQSMAAFFHLSVSQLERLSRKYFGMGVVALYNQKRMVQARVLLSNSDLSVGEIARRTGFGEMTNFSNFFTKNMGMSPSSFRRFKR
ncbi:MAG: AraC family transcriptional regulator [Eubacteriales bacterium]|nr:AraC family transcriptional regulator [Eubacteriales bacterium]